MSNKGFVKGMLCLVAAGFMWAVTGQAQQTRPRVQQAPAGKLGFALLVGINDYQNPNIADLNGAENDARRMREVLRDRFGFPADESHIKLLLGREATADNIRQQFQAVLVENAKRFPRASFVFYFSGHGSQAPDTNGDEDDGQDETLVPYDSRDSVNRHFDLKDDEIGNWANELSRHTPNALYIFDSCHSGTVNRRGAEQAREIPADTRPQPQEPARPRRNENPDNEATDFLPANDGYTMLAACLSYEKAREDGNAKRGVFSTYLLEALNNARADTTYSDLLNTVARNVSYLRSDQHPQLQGDGSKLVLNGAASAADQYLRINRINGKQITLAATKETGIGKGAFVAFYDQKEARLAGAQGRKAVGQVVTVTEDEAVVEVDAKLDVTDKAILISPLFGSDKLRVGLAGAEDAPVLRAVAAQLAGSHLMETVFLPPDQTQPARKLATFVRRDRQDKAFENRPLHDAGGQRVALSSDEVYYLTDLSGEPLYGFYVQPSDPKAATKIVDALTKRVRQLSLGALENRVTAFQQPSDARSGNNPARVSVQFLRVTLRQDAEGRNHIDQEVEVAPDRLEMGDNFRVQVSNQTLNDRFYAYILNLSTDGGINLMYPRSCGGAEIIQPRQTAKGGVYQLVPPAGYEGFKIIVSYKPAPNICYLTQDGVARGIRATRSPIDLLMEQALDGNLVRGDEARDVDSWATLGFAISIKPQ